MSKIWKDGIIVQTEQDEIDEWFCLDEHNDLNVYTDLDGNMKVVVYPVVDGETKTDVFKQLWPIIK